MRLSFLPYEARKDADIWPDGAKLAVLFHTAPENYDWTAFGQPGHHGPPVHRASQDKGRPDLTLQSTIEYGFRIGLPRIIELVSKVGIPFSFFVGGRAAESAPDMIRKVAQTGYSVVAHSYDQGAMIQSMTVEQQSAAIDKSVSVIESVTGKRPLGWESPGSRLNRDLIRVLFDRQFSYFIGMEDDELPYFVEDGQTRRKMVSIPYRSTGALVDIGLLAQTRTSIDEALLHCKATFRSYREVSQQTPMILSFGGHPYFSGRPEGAQLIVEFAKYVQTFPDVWITDYDHLADWWERRFSNHEKLKTVEFPYI